MAKVNEENGMTDRNFDQNSHMVGVWHLTLAAPTGEQRVRIDVALEDNCYRGTATQGSETVALRDFSVQGNSASWHQHIKKPFPMRIDFELLFLESEVSGICKPGIFPKVKVFGRRDLT